MLNSNLVSQLINDVTYELDLRFFGAEYGSFTNTAKIAKWHEKVKNDHPEVFASEESVIAITMAQIEALLAEEESKPIKIPTSELKNTYSKFMAGELNPKLQEWNNKRGVAMLEETSDTARSNSDADKLDLFDTVRSREYIDNLVEKYKPADAIELMCFFDRA
jgi:hypothetical protein